MSTTPKKHEMLVTLDDELHAAIKASADESGIPAATLAASRLRRAFLGLAVVEQGPEAMNFHSGTRASKLLKRDVTPLPKKKDQK